MKSYVIYNTRSNYKSKTIRLTNILTKSLLKYLEIRKTLTLKNAKNNDALFLSEKLVRICPRGIRFMIKVAYEKTELSSEKYSVHTLRHTCATLLYRTGIDIKIIKEILGHVRIETTEIYTHLYNKKTMETMLQHPLAKFKMANAMAFCMT